MMALWEYSCEECECFRAEWQGTSIYGPDEVSWCEHPANCGHSPETCPRKAMSAEELVDDLAESLERHSQLTMAVESLLAAYDDEQRARDRGTPYSNQSLDTPAKIIERLRHEYHQAIGSEEART